MHVVREFFLQKVLFTLEKVTVWSLWQIPSHDIVPSVMTVIAVIKSRKTTVIRIHLRLKKWESLVFWTLWDSKNSNEGLFSYRSCGHLCSGTQKEKS